MVSPLGEVAVGEFADVLRAQIAETHAKLAAARANRDFETITPQVLRLRYLLDVAVENGVTVEEDTGASTGSA
ncbi:MAG TPA: hypothetical protein VL551_29200, partial [Actinospica sp.]|nr:hypothetical protein [Actinospica sp.]